MAKKKVELKDNPVVLVGGAILVLVLMFVGLFSWGATSG